MGLDVWLATLTDLLRGAMVVGILLVLAWGAAWAIK